MKNKIKMRKENYFDLIFIVELRLLFKHLHHVTSNLFMKINIT